jgi:peptide deformylase
MARVFQHELDHLDGQCFVEKVGKLSLKMAQVRRKKNLR